MLSSLCPFFTPFILGPRLPSGCAALGHPAGPAVTRVRGSLGRPASAPTGSGRTAVAAAAAGRPAWRTGRAGCGGGWPTRGQDSFALLFVSPSKPVSLALHPPLLPSSICPRASRCRLAFFTHNTVLIFLFSLGRKRAAHYCQAIQEVVQSHNGPLSHGQSLLRLSLLPLPT